MSNETNLADCSLKLLHQLGKVPEVAIILGSGFQPVANIVKVTSEFDYRDLPGFPPPGVQGHAGKLIIGELHGKTVAILSGRAHYYEGHDMEQVTFAVRVLSRIGVKTLLLTNAAGGLNAAFTPGDFMVLSDHINFLGTNPLRGDKSGLTKFIDMSEVYDYKLRQKLLLAAKHNKLKVQQGIYLAVCGPSYETPAEIRAFKTLGADAVGMSTVPEAIVARQCGMQVAGISCITNMAAGVTGEHLSHQEVLDIAKKVSNSGSALISEFIKLL